MGEQGPSLGHSLADTLAQILLRPDKRSPFLALGSAAVSGRPAALEKITGTMFVSCLKMVGKKKIKTYTGCCPMKAVWWWGALHVSLAEHTEVLSPQQPM